VLYSKGNYRAVIRATDTLPDLQTLHTRRVNIAEIIVGVTFLAALLIPVLILTTIGGC
jgi:hypothetical protein